MIPHELKDLLFMSHSVGRRLHLIQGGGGNSSVKTRNGRIYIKSSGILLKSMSEDEGYTVLDRRTGQALQKFQHRRPSMEWPMHLFLPTYVLHTHPVYVNVFNCMKNGEKILLDIFSDFQPIYIHYQSPGNALAMEIEKEVQRYTASHAKGPTILFLENHGLITCGQDPKQVTKRTHMVSATLKWVLSKRVKRFQPFTKKCLGRTPRSQQSFFPDSAVFLASTTITQGIHEIFAANAYIEQTIRALGGTPRHLSKREVYHVQHMEAEQFRIAVADRHK